MNRDQMPVIEGSDVFDEYRDEDVVAVAGSILAPSVQNLLLTLRQINLTQDSFGADHKKVVEALLPDLKLLRAACLAKWRNL